MRIASACAAALALLVVAAPAAHARITDPPAGLVVRYPSGQAPDPAALQAAILSPTVSAIVFTKGTSILSERLFVFKRSGLTLCGETGDPRDVILESSATPVFQVEQSIGTVFRGLTIRSTATGGTGVFLNAAPNAATEGFADDTSVERCDFEGYVGVQASVRARNLSVADGGFTVSGFSPGSASGGVGVLWEDGPGLFVTRSRFFTARGVSAIAGIFVRGAQTPSSAGDRAKQLLVTRNTIAGDFAVGMDLADVKDAVVSRNRVRFPDSVVAGSRGRVGIVVRRAAATQFTEDFELSRNVVRRAHYGLWLIDTGEGGVTRNDLRGCGSAALDAPPPTGFNDFGGAMRMNVLGGACPVTIEDNDFRNLRSPADAAAVVLFPTAGVCTESGSPGNRRDRGRPLFGGPQP